jgi:hypothetical protein
VSGPSTACAECRALVGGYVLGALEPDEAETVRRHITACPECASEHAHLAGLPDLLTLVTADSSAEHPPAALEEAVLDRFAREHRADRSEPGRPAQRTLRQRLAALLRPLRRPLPAAVAGALTAAAAAAALVLFVGDDPDGRVYGAKLSGTSAEAGARAYAKLTTSSSGTRVYLKVHGLRGNPDDLYELWCVKDDGTKISAGTFRVDARGEAAVNLTTAAVPGQYHRMAVERKPGEQVMVGSIQY